MSMMRDAGIPFLVGGAYAMARYAEIERHTKDFDVFVRPGDAGRVLGQFADAGFQTERTHPHWLGKVYDGEAFVDVIYRSGNAVAEVDDEWFACAVDDEVLGMPAALCPAEEIIWSKSFVMERERFDGADVAHLLRARGRQLDWARLLRRFGSSWPVLLCHLVLFEFIYPANRDAVPRWVMDDLLGRQRAESQAGATGDRACRGTLLSRSQYLVDLELWGYEDARLEPRGAMSKEEIDHWTQSIELDGTL